MLSLFQSDCSNKIIGVWSSRWPTAIHRLGSIGFPTIDLLTNEKSSGIDSLLYIPSRCLNNATKITGSFIVLNTFFEVGGIGSQNAKCIDLRVTYTSYYTRNQSINQQVSPPESRFSQPPNTSFQAFIFCQVTAFGSIVKNISNLNLRSYFQKVIGRNSYKTQCK